MKILQISPQFIYPATDGGKIGIFYISKYLAKYNDLTFLALHNQDIDTKNINYMKSLYNLEIFKINNKNTIWNMIKAIFKNKPLYLDKHLNANLLKKIDLIIKDNNFDLVHLDHTATAALGVYIKEKYNIPIALRLHNVEHLIWERYAQNLNKFSPKYLYIHYQANLLKKYELDLISKMDMNVAISTTDEEIIKSYLPNSKICIVSAGIDTNSWEIPKFEEKSDNELIIASTWSWVHNVDGLLWFINNVFNLMLKDYPNIKLRILGKNFPINKLKTNENIIVEGFVDQIQPYFKKANVYIAPLFVGSGIRIKILEAMAAGLPVIATSVSAEGILAGEENGLFIKDEPLEQIKIIKYLLENKEETHELGLKAQKYVNEHFSWESKIIELNEIYKNLIK